MPTISVIVPVYKVEAYLHRCVDSILNQTYRDFELILVDDGSPDNCGTICDAYANTDARVVVIHQDNRGLSAARNAGLDWAFANSDSNWITFIDSDDWVRPEYLDCLLQTAIAHSSEISACKHFPVSDSEPPVYPITLSSQQLTPEDFFCLQESNLSVISAWGKLYAKTLFTSYRYPVGKLHEDLFLTPRIIFSANSIAQTENVLYFYYLSPGSIMRSTWSPKRLAEIEGYKELLNFLHQEKYRSAEKTAVRSYFIALYFQCLSVSQTHGFWFYSAFLKLTLSMLILRYRALFSATFSNDIWMYEVLYPRFMKLFWYFIAIKKRIRNLFRS